jgi:hypothetical protein
MIVEIKAPRITTGAPIEPGQIGAVVDVVEGYKKVLYYKVEFLSGDTYWFEESDFKQVQSALADKN